MAVINYKGTPKDRFLKKIKKEGNCWIWTATKTQGGYGTFFVNGGKVLAHRFSYELFNGNIDVGMCVCHLCDNPQCVNPKHLWLGTYSDNIKDMIKKGRARYPDRKFEKNNKAKLTWGDIPKIRELGYSGKYTQLEIANLYGVGRTVIGNVLRKEKWIR